MFTTGALLGVALLFPLFYIIGDVPWSMEVAVTGLIVGGLAGFLSAKHFQKVFEDRSM